MNIHETKLELVKIILNTNEEALLEQVKELLSSSGEDWWDKITPAERRAIDEGLEQANQGQLIPHEQVVEAISKRFNK